MIINCSSYGSKYYCDGIYMHTCLRTNISQSRPYLAGYNNRFECLMMINKQIKMSFARREYGALFAVKL